MTYGKQNTYKIHMMTKNNPHYKKTIKQQKYITNRKTNEAHGTITYSYR